VSVCVSMCIQRLPGSCSGCNNNRIVLTTITIPRSSFLFTDRVQDYCSDNKIDGRFGALGQFCSRVILFYIPTANSHGCVNTMIMFYTSVVSSRPLAAQQLLPHEAYAISILLLLCDGLFFRKAVSVIIDEQ